MLYLRRIREGDLEALFEQRNDPEIYKWCRQNAPLHWDNHLAWFKRQSADSSMSMFAIAQDHEVVGACGLTSIDMVNSRAEFSLYISKAHQSLGYGKLALVSLLAHGFIDLGLNRIWGESFDGNPALELFYKLGFELEGTRRDFYYRSGNFIDAKLVSISRLRFDSLHTDKPSP